jgi:uncharacterized lipoprotein YmbA
MKRLILPTLLALTLSACATGPQSPQVLAGKTLLAMKETIIATATTGGVLCNKGQLTKKDCATIEHYYVLAQPAYDMAADALTLALMKNDDAAWQRYQSEQGHLRTIFDDLVRMSVTIDAVNGGVK